MKQIINVSDINEYLYCPRKFWLKRVKGLREPFTKPMFLGKLNHTIIELFNKNEQFLVSSIKEKISQLKLAQEYENLIRKIISEIFQQEYSRAKQFQVSQNEFARDFLSKFQREITLRTASVLQTIEKGFLGSDLWANLSPKFISEFSIISDELGLKGRIDRIRIQDSSIVPYELKSREEIFESDKLQLSAYVLLLEDKFHMPIEKGIIEVNSKAEEIPISEELKKKVLDTAEEIRNLQSPPPLLSNFKKCQSCALSQICVEAS